MKVKYQIALDVGGTGIKGRLCYDGGFVGEALEFPSQADAEKEALIAHLCSICEMLIAQAPVPEARCSRIAMAFPGPFDYDRGIPYMQGLAKYEMLYGVALPSVMTAHWYSAGVHSFDGVGWRFINDVSAFALGAVDKNGLTGRTMCVCIGTGAGSAFCIGDSLCTDINEGMPEMGWIYPLPFHGSIIDDILSARGITKIAKKHCKAEMSPLELAIEAKAGSTEALAAWDEYGGLLREALMPIATDFRADAFILGGKIALSAEYFLAELSQACESAGVAVLIESDTSLLTERGLWKV